MDYNWNWGVLFEEQYLSWLISGVGWTFSVALSAWVLALLVGVLIGVGRTLPSRPIAFLCTTYVEIFRNVPLLVQLFLWYFVVPEIVPQDMGRRSSAAPGKQETPSFPVGLAPGEGHHWVDRDGPPVTGPVCSYL